MNGRRRIFIAINLPENIKKRLLSYQKKWADLPAIWTKEHNLHITLAFLGYVRDENISDILDKTKKAVEDNDVFDITLNKIIYGPPKKFPPRMVWAQGEKNRELSELQLNLDRSLFSGINQNLEKYIPDIKKEARVFSPHITLARIRQMAFQRMEKEEIPEVNEDINLNFPVSSVEIMESELKKSGPVYTILESIDLKP